MSWKNQLINVLSRLLHGEPPVIKAQVVTLAPNQLLKGRCALITGGTSGIGFAIARAFLDAGAIVVITGRSQQRIDSALLQLNAQGRAFG